jgi:hypothetical protein
MGQAMYKQPTKAFESLTRPQIIARIEFLRHAMDDLAAIAELDGGPVFACMGRMKVTLIHLERHLRAMDRGDFTPIPLAVRAAMEAQK